MIERVKMEDIFKPGAKFTLDVDVDSPKFKALLEETARRQAEIRAHQHWTQEDYDAMRNVITI